MEYAANLLMVEVDKLKKLAREFYDRKNDPADKIDLITSAVATSLVVAVLETLYSKLSNRWSLIVAKANLFVRGVAATHKLNLTSIRQSVDKFIKSNIKAPQDTN